MLPPLTPEVRLAIWIAVGAAGISMSILAGPVTRDLLYRLRRWLQPSRAGRPPSKPPRVVMFFFWLSALIVILGTAVASSAPEELLSEGLSRQDEGSVAFQSDMPDLEVMSPSNASNLEQLSIFGRGPLVDVAWTADDAYLLIADSSGLAMLRGADYQEERYLVAEGSLLTMTVGQTGRFVAVLEDTITATFSGKTARVINLSDGSTYFEVEVSAGYEPVTVAINSQESKLAVAETLTVSVYDLDTQQRIGSFSVPDDPETELERVEAMTFIDSAGGLLVAYGSQATLVSLETFDVLRSFTWRDAQEDHRYRGSPPYPVAVAVTSDESRLAISVSDENVYIWSLESGALVNKVHSPFNLVQGLVFDQDGDLLFGSANGGLLRWELTSGEIRTAASNGARELDISHDSHRVALVESANTLTIRDPDTLGVAETYQGGNIVQPSQLLFLPKADHLVVLGDTTTYWDIRGLPPQPSSRFGQVEFGRRATVSSDGNLLVGRVAGGVRAWNLLSDEISFISTGHTHLVWAMALSNNDRWLATGDEDGLIVLTDLLSHEQVRVWGGQGTDRVVVESGDLGSVNALAFSPTWSVLLASVHLGGMVNFWNTATGERMGSDLAGEFNAQDVDFSYDGKMAAVHSDTGVRLYSIDNDFSLFAVPIPLMPTSYRSESGTLDLSPQSYLLAVGLGDTVRLIDGKTGAEITQVTPGFNQIIDVAFGPNGKLLVILSRGGQVSLWGVPVK